MNGPSRLFTASKEGMIRVFVGCGVYKGQVHRIWCLVDIVWLVFLFLNGKCFGWIAFPLLLNRACEAYVIVCSRTDENTRSFTVFQPLLSLLALVSCKSKSFTLSHLLPLFLSHILLILLLFLPWREMADAWMVIDLEDESEEKDEEEEEDGLMMVDLETSEHHKLILHPSSSSNNHPNKHISLGTSVII